VAVWVVVFKLPLSKSSLNMPKSGSVGVRVVKSLILENSKDFTQRFYYSLIATSKYRS